MLESIKLYDLFLDLDEYNYRIIPHKIEVIPLMGIQASKPHPIKLIYV